MKSQRDFFCRTANGASVFYDSASSHAATHFKEKPELPKLVAEALATQKPGRGKFIPLVIDMHRIVGRCDLVDVDDSDVIVYALREGRPEDGLVPFTKSREAQSCSTVAIWLASAVDGYDLVSAWIGTIDDQHFPEHPDATPENVAFWRKHAFVWGTLLTVPGTETNVCPW